MNADRWTEADIAHMTRALDLASAQVGRTGDNPAVGCVIVKDGVIVAEAATADGGRPHAEELALAAIGDQARGAMAYVTLEPCNQRSTGAPSCSELLARAKLKKVVFACADPHPFASGGGVQRMRAAGIDVDVGLLSARARRINQDFFARVRQVK